MCLDKTRLEIRLEILLIFYQIALIVTIAWIFEYTGSPIIVNSELTGSLLESEQVTELPHLIFLLFFCLLLQSLSWNEMSSNIITCLSNPIECTHLILHYFIIFMLIGLSICTPIIRNSHWNCVLIIITDRVTTFNPWNTCYINTC